MCVVVLFAQGCTGELAPPAATDHSPQEVGVLLVVAPCERAVVRELLSDQLEVLFSYDSRHAPHRDPLLWWERDSGVVGPSDGAESGSPYLGRPVRHTPGVDLSGVDGISQYPAQGGERPDLPPPGREDPTGFEFLRDPKEALAFLEVHRKYLCHYGCLLLI